MSKSKLPSVLITLFLIGLGASYLTQGEASSLRQVDSDFGVTDDDSDSHRESRVFRLWPGFAKPVDNGGATCTVNGKMGTCHTKQSCAAKGGKLLDYSC